MNKSLKSFQTSRFLLPRKGEYNILQRCSYSLLSKIIVPNEKNLRSEFDHAVSLVKMYDPSGYLPGVLLGFNDARLGYFAVRAFFVDTGLRMRTHPLANSLSQTIQIGGVGKRGIEIPNEERIRYWKQGVEAIYDDNLDVLNNNPTLKLLNYVVKKHNLSRKHFERILLGREKDVDMKQYPTIESLQEHSVMYCGSLLHLVLECMGIRPKDDDITKATEHAAICHGLANALRLSIPIVSTTGKLIIPIDLCVKHGIKSPRYLLSSLGMGDEECRTNMQHAVEEISDTARKNLASARILRENILTDPLGSQAMSAFLPLIPSEKFLDRLSAHNYDLTNRSLRSVGFMEKVLCTKDLIKASISRTF